MPKALAKKIKKQDTIAIKAAVSNLNDLNLQKKAFVSLVASKVLCKFLREQKITVISENNNSSGLLLLKDFDIANIRVENNIKIAVRAIVGDDYPQMCIPRSHFLNDILADIYVGIRVETKIDRAEFVGFIEVSQINKQKGNNRYVSVEADQLRPIDTLKQAINSLGKHKSFHLASDHEKTIPLFFKYIENRISSSDKEFLVRHIASCHECSEEFNQIIELDNMIKKASPRFNFEETDTDYTLRLFAGDPLLLGEAIEINLEEGCEDCENPTGVLENIQNAADEIKESEKPGRKNKKRISERKIIRAVATAGKLALISGTILSGGQVVSAIQAAGLFGLINGAGKTIATPLAESITEILSDNIKNNENSDSVQTTSNVFETEECLELNKSEENILLSEIDNQPLNIHRESIILKDNEPETGSLHEESPEAQVIAADSEVFYSIDDLLSSLDSVETVDPFSFFDFSQTENSNSGLFEETEKPEVKNTELKSELESQPENIATTSPLEIISQEKEQTTNLVNELHLESESVPVKYQGIQFNNDSEEKIISPAANQIITDFEQDGFDTDEEQYNAGSKKGKLLPKNLKTAGIVAGIAVTIAIALWINNKPAANNNLPFVNNPVSETGQIPQNADSVPPVTKTSPVTSAGSVSKSAKPAENSRKDLSAVLADAFSRRTSEVNIRNISWEITKDMAQNPIFKNYIMVTGQALKSALSRDLAQADERALNTQMEIKTVMDTKGNILEATVLQSSGSDEVDKICLNTFKTTVQFTKLPKITVKKDKIKANLIVSF